MKQLQVENGSKLLVYSTGKAEKESEIVNRREKLFLEEAERLIRVNQNGHIIKADKILIRIGRLKEKYGSTAARYDFDLEKISLNRRR